jgi:hypothetical protein
MIEWRLNMGRSIADNTLKRESTDQSFFEFFMSLVTGYNNRKFREITATITLEELTIKEQTTRVEHDLVA